MPRVLSRSIVFILATCAGHLKTVNAAQAAAPPAQAAPTSPHDIADTWQGTLHAGQDLRTVVKITKDDKGAYKGVFYSLDQGAQPINLDSVTLTGQDVKLVLKLFNLTYEGKLSADGKTIDGSFQPGRQPASPCPHPRHARDRLGDPQAATSSNTHGRRCRSQL